MSRGDPDHPSNQKAFRMNSLHSVIGHELSFTTNQDGLNLITFAIRPCKDLNIHSDVLVEITFSSKFLLNPGEVVMRARNPSDFSCTTFLQSSISVTAGFNGNNNNSNSNSGDILHIPWLDTVTKYPILVWFYTVRRALRKTNRSPWLTPILVESSFLEHKKKYNEEANLTEVNEIDRFLLTDIAESRSHSSSITIGSKMNNSTSSKDIVLISGAGRTKGRRNYMEDVDFVYDAIRVSDKRTISVFGVLDGHGGKECALYAADEIPVKISALLRGGNVVFTKCFFYFTHLTLL